MPRSMRAFLCLTVLLLPACAGLQHQMAANQYVSQQTLDHVYQRNLAEVWPYARQLLFEYGYSVRDTGEGMTFTAETEWRAEQNGSSRYLVQGFVLGDRACRVQFTRVDSGPMGDRWNRDVAMEWTLLRRAEPEAAAQLEADGQRYANSSVGAP